MRNYLLIVIIAALAFAKCQSKSENEKKDTSTFQTSEIETKSNEDVKRDLDFKEPSFIVERLIPENTTTADFDTLLSEQKIQILLKKTYLESYVADEYEINDTIYHDKYLDAKIHLNIRKGETIFIDTAFTKSTFSKFMDREFMEIARFHNYWFRKLTDSRLEFFGVISKPETDWTFAFSHYFDLKSKTLAVVPHEDI